jgi:hypothetical protein
MSYRIFKRTWWVENPAWPNGLEPGADKRHYVRGLVCETEDEARAECHRLQAELNRTMTATQRRLSLKYEYEAC